MFRKKCKICSKEFTFKDPNWRNKALLMKMMKADSSLSLKEVSLKLNKSPKYLSRFFKENTKMNYKDFTLVSRIERAKHLLVQTDLGLREISKKLGYKNSESFNRLFKKYTNCTPARYRIGQFSKI